MTDTDGANVPDNEAAKSGGASGKIAIVVVVLLIAFAVLYVLTDRMASSSSRGIVSAHVVQIAPPVSGEVIGVAVEDDAVVQAGDVLFRLDPRSFELAVAQVEANLAQATQGVQASAASLIAAQAQVTQARSALDTARAEADRTYRLEERGIASTAQGDVERAKVSDAQARLATAQANLDSARSQLGSEGDDDPANAAAQSSLEKAQYDLASTTGMAPHFGVVTNVTLAEGQFIGAGNPALTFIDAAAAWITLDLRENQLQHVEPGDPVRILFDAVPGQIFTGRVASIAWGINPGRSAQGGLIVNQPSNRWFEPARQIPVRVELHGRRDSWPRKARVGGKVHAVILADGTSNPIALLARGMQWMRSWASYLH